MGSPDAKGEIGVCRISGFLFWGPSRPITWGVGFCLYVHFMSTSRTFSSALHSGVHRLLLQVLLSAGPS